MQKKKTHSLNKFQNILLIIYNYFRGDPKPSFFPSIISYLCLINMEYVLIELMLCKWLNLFIFWDFTEKISKEKKKKPRNTDIWMVCNHRYEWSIKYERYWIMALDRMLLKHHKKSTKMKQKVVWTKKWKKKTRSQNSYY